MPHKPDPTANRFLKALPQDIRQQWLEQGRVLTLQRGDIVSATSSDASFVFCPLNAVLAWVSWLRDGASGAIALIGREGMVCLKDLQGQGHQLVVLHAGQVLKLPASLVESSERLSPVVRKLRTDNLQALISQASQTALCNQHHSLQQRLMRLLECIFERMGSESLRITQSQLADLLGTRRERVSHAAAALEDMGLIQRTRGQIRITDLCRLHPGQCDCCVSMRLPRGYFTPEPSDCGSRSA